MTWLSSFFLFFFFFNDTATTEIYTLSLHDALPISPSSDTAAHHPSRGGNLEPASVHAAKAASPSVPPSLSSPAGGERDRKSTRLNSSHANISYAVFCLKKKKN